MNDTDRRNCYNCEHMEYGFGDVSDPEGWICNKKDLYGKEEDKMIRNMGNSKYRFKSKVCFMPFTKEGE